MRIETKLFCKGDQRKQIEKIKDQLPYDAPVTAAYFEDTDETIFIQIAHEKAPF